MSGELLRLPATTIWQGLERLNKSLGADSAGLWDRLRLDPEYHAAVTKSMRQEDKRLIGDKFDLLVDRSKSRWELSRRMSELGYQVIKEEIINGVEPLSAHAHVGQESFVEDLHCERMEVFLPQMHRSFDREGMMEEIARRGLESVRTEEALTFAIQCCHSGRDPLRMGILIPGARIMWQKETTCLKLGRVIAGIPQLSLWPERYGIQQGMTVLARKVIPATEVQTAA